MVLAIVALVMTDPSVNFIEECRKAVTAVDKGEWSIEFNADGEDATAKTQVSATLIRRFHDTYGVTKINGEALSEFVVKDGNSLYIDYSKGVYAEWKAAKWSEGVALAKEQERAEKNEFHYTFSAERGFMFVINPSLKHGVVTREGSVETLSADLVHDDGIKRGTMRYERDFKTKLPLRASVSTKDTVAHFNFRIVPRKVEADELAIPPSRYEKLRKVDPKETQTTLPVP